jgi:ribonuclease E
MSKVMLVNVSHEEESRVALVEGGVLESLEIESVSRSLKGNIYKAVVQNVNAALEAAFVDYGDERAGFLPLDEVNFKVLPALPGRDSHRRGRITDHLSAGMEILVQVIRDAFNTKPPTFTTFYSLPGRYLVLTPKSDGQGISRKIEDIAQRDRLRKIVEELNPPEGCGLIVRTAGMGQSKTELQRDLRYLLRLWESVDKAAGIHRAPSLIYQERDIVLRTIRDHFTHDIEEVLIDDEEVHRKASRFVQAIMPAKEKVFKLYRGDKPLFSKYNLEDQIESIFRREVTLKSGGAIVIDTTEAMTTIDVNSARSAREANIEDTALKTNLEAAEEIARQLRLRDLGGLTVIDFIDMYQDKHTRQVEKTVREALKKDRAKWDITRISKFGLLEISRQRIKVAKASAAYTSCGRCEGTGVVKTTEAAALSVFRRLQARVVKGDLSTLRATLPEEVAVYLLNQKREELHSLERRYGTRIVLVPHPTMNPNRGEFETIVREEGEAPPARPPLPAQVASRAEDSLPREVPEPPPAPEAAPPEPEPVVSAAVSGASRPSSEPPLPKTEEAAAREGEGVPAQAGAAKKRRRRRRRPGPTDGAPEAEKAPPTGESERPAGEVETPAGQIFLLPWEPPPPGQPQEAVEEAVPPEEGAARQTTGPAEEPQSVDGQPRRRRRRRRRRPRRATASASQASAGPDRAGPGEPAGHGAPTAAPASHGAASGSPPRSAEGPTESEPRSAPAGPAPDRTAAPGHKKEEEEVPGGWWQRLTGGSRRGRPNGGT